GPLPRPPSVAPALGGSLPASGLSGSSAEGSAGSRLRGVRCGICRRAPVRGGGGFARPPGDGAGARRVLEPMSRADMLMLLLDQTFNLRIVDSRGVARLAEMLRGAECYRLRIGDLAEAVGLIAASVEEGSS